MKQKKTSRESLWGFRSIWSISMPVPPESTSAPRATLLRFPRGGSRAGPEFSTFTVTLSVWPTGLFPVALPRLPWNPPGIYWIPVFEILESRGFEVKLVNACHVKNVPGRKSDVLDCQWLQQLHTYGLLRGAFRPADGWSRFAPSSATGDTGKDLRVSHSAYAEGNGPDESATAQRCQ